MRARRFPRHGVRLYGPVRGRYKTSSRCLKAFAELAPLPAIPMTAPTVMLWELVSSECSYVVLPPRAMGSDRGEGRTDGLRHAIPPLTSALRTPAAVRGARSVAVFRRAAFAGSLGIALFDAI